MAACPLQPSAAHSDSVRVRCASGGACTHSENANRRSHLHTHHPCAHPHYYFHHVSAEARTFTLSSSHTLDVCLHRPPLHNPSPSTLYMQLRPSEGWHFVSTSTTLPLLTWAVNRMGVRHAAEAGSVCQQHRTAWLRPSCERVGKKAQTGRWGSLCCGALLSTIFCARLLNCSSVQLCL